jgi:hypothetical protein
MAAANFNRKSAKELQKYLKERGVTFSDLRKAELVEICEAADRLGIDVDPDGLLEDREDILREKLLIPEGLMLPNPETVKGSQDLRILPPFAIFDIYNYLLTFDQHSHSLLRNYQKMEGFGLFEDGYVLNIKCCSLGGHYSAVKSNVRPRTNGIDPVSKAWIVFSKSDKGTVVSAYCSYKGGLCIHNIYICINHILQVY